MIIIPDVILFDLDDTLISFNGVTEEALKTACKAFLRESSMPVEASVLIEAVNRVKLWYWSDPARHRQGRLDLDNTRRQLFKRAFELLDYYNEYEAFYLADTYTRYQEDMIHLFPESLITLQYLYNAGVKMGLITNGSSKKQRYKIDRFSLNQYFHLILIEEEVGYGKPDLRIYQRALSLLNLEASRVWMVGDNLNWDIEAPQKLGIYSIWANYQREALEKNSSIVPDRIIFDISEFQKII